MVEPARLPPAQAAALAALVRAPLEFRAGWWVEPRGGRRFQGQTVEALIARKLARRRTVYAPRRAIAIATGRGLSELAP